MRGLAGSASCGLLHHQRIDGDDALPLPEDDERIDLGLGDDRPVEKREPRDADDGARERVEVPFGRPR